MSFVNIPADEYAGVKEAIITEQKDASEVSLYASNDSEKVLADLGSGENLYAMIDSETEDSDTLVAYLLDKSSKTKKMDKEEDVTLTELTRDQLKDHAIVKELIDEAVKKAVEDASKDCESKLKKLAEDCVKNSAPADTTIKAEDAKAESAPTTPAAEVPAAVEGEDAKKKKKEEEETEDEKKKRLAGTKPQKGAEENSKEEEETEDEKKKKKEKKEEEEEEEEEKEEDKKKKKGAPVPNVLPENKGKGKSGGVKHGAGNLSPTGEDPGDSAKVEELESHNKKMLDENVKINSELHKMVAERLYDLKKILRKPDVVGVSTPDARNKKVEEFAQRSIDSLKDQINDLLVEQENALSTGFDGKAAENPAIAQSDVTNEVIQDKLKKNDGKKETLTRLFPKSK
jgi:hypothetical protein